MSGRATWRAGTLEVRVVRVPVAGDGCSLDRLVISGPAGRRRVQGNPGDPPLLTGDMSLVSRVLRY